MWRRGRSRTKVCAAGIGWEVLDLSGPYRATFEVALAQCSLVAKVSSSSADVPWVRVSGCIEGIG